MVGFWIQLEEGADRIQEWSVRMKKKKSGMTPTINRRMKLPFIAMGRTLGGVDFKEKIRSSAY